jgi:hypothetical protein
MREMEMGDYIDAAVSQRPSYIATCHRSQEKARIHFWKLQRRWSCPHFEFRLLINRTMNE